MRRLIAAAGAGYAIGNVPVADAVARFVAPHSPDLRSIGSGNPGAVNVGRELGGRWGVLVSVLDVGKGAVAAYLGRTIAGAHGSNVAASSAVVGHCHPVGRSGGKGVATSVGQVIGTFPRYLPVDVIVAVATAAVPAWKRRSFAATAAASIVWITSATIAWWRRWPTGTDEAAPGSLPIGAALSSAVIARRFADDPRAGWRPG